MSEFRTFSGKTVDDAMEEACRHFGEPREKLEVEILSGGSSGIFGLVGKKKAQVRARVREEIHLSQERENPPARREPPAKAEKTGRSPKAAKPAAPAAETAGRPKEVPAAPAAKPEPVAPPEPVAVSQPSSDGVAPEDGVALEDESASLDAREAETPEAQAESSAPREERRAGAPETPPQPLTPELEAIVREVMDQMLDGILGQVPPYEISGHSERVSVLILDEENSGLLIGREGQTLASIQYLVNRIVIRRHGSPVKVQINTGEYRERQDDNLRKMAIFLADKAKTLGRPQSTKPLSSYHRRVVHLALQEDELVSTRSKGDGPLKRVLIVPRNARGEAAQAQQNNAAQPQSQPQRS